MSDEFFFLRNIFRNFGKQTCKSTVDVVALPHVESKSVSPKHRERKNINNQPLSAITSYRFLRVIFVTSTAPSAIEIKSSVQTYYELQVHVTVHH